MKGEATLAGVKLLVNFHALVPEPPARAGPLPERPLLGLVRVDAEDGCLRHDLRFFRALRQHREFPEGIEIAPARGAIRLAQPHATSSR